LLNTLDAIGKASANFKSLSDPWADTTTPLLSAMSGAMNARHFPPPWTIEELDACFVVSDANGQKLTYVYFEVEPGRRSVAKLLRGRLRVAWTSCRTRRATG
jgi:hypothetical protein